MGRKIPTMNYLVKNNIDIKNMTKMRSSRHDVTHEEKNPHSRSIFYYSLISGRREYIFFNIKVH